MFKNKNTILGALLIAVLFLWATHNTESQQNAMRTQLQQKQAAEKAKLDSLKAIKGEHVLATPELVAAPVASAAVVPATKADSAVALSALKHRLIVVETDRFWVTLDNQGGMIRSIVAKTLKNHEGQYPELIQNEKDGALSLKLDSVDFAQVMFSVDSTLPDTVHVTSPTTIGFTWKNALGQSLVREYRFTQDSDKIRHNSRFAGFKPQLYTLEWKGGMRETETFPTGKSLMGGSNYFFSEVILNNSYNVERLTLNKQTWFNRQDGKARWVGLRRKYIAGVINWNGESEAAIGADPISAEKPDPGTYALTISDHPQSDSIAFDFVVLPLVYNKIAGMGESYGKIMFSGWEWMGADHWFVALCGYLLQLLNWFYSMIPNYGVAIILLTLLMKLITMPLTVKQLKSTREMQRHKPAMDEIRLRNRANPQKMQQELMAYYAKNGVNPFAAMFGCFTMILQMPVFISLYVVLGRAVELRYAPFAGWIHDLSSPDIIYAGLQIPVLFPQGVTILPFIMMLTTYFQTKQTIVDPNQKSMVYIMPLMMFVFSSVMPSGLILYWIVSNLFGIAQFRLLNRKPLAVVVPAHEHMQNKARKNIK